MTLKRWGLAFLQLGLLLLAIGLLPALGMMVLAPAANAMVPALLSLTVAPLGALCLVAGLVMWSVGVVRR